MCPIRPGTRSHYTTQAAFEPEITLPQPSDAEMASYFLSGMFFICPHLDVHCRQSCESRWDATEATPIGSCLSSLTADAGQGPGEQVHTIRA